MNKQKRPAYDR